MTSLVFVDAAVAQTSAQKPVLAGGAIVGGAGLPAQSAEGARTVAGRVMKPSPITDKTRTPKTRADSEAVDPVSNVMVTLHRVGKDTQGPVDSVRTKSDGRYQFNFRTSGAPDAVYFTSVSYGGIAYFTAPLRNQVVNGADAEITVYDTTSRAFPLSVAGRHLIVSAADTSETRTIVEVYELSNDSLKTLIAKENNAAPTWSVAIPKAAAKLKADESELSPDAFTHAPGRLAIYGALSPGIKQISFSYKLATSEFPMPFVIEHGATVLEVLIEEPQGLAVGGGLKAVEPVKVENRTFRRFVAQDVKDNETVTIQLPSGSVKARNLYIASLLAASGAAMLLMLGRAMQRRKPIGYAIPEPQRVAEPALADRLAREIAELDRTFAKHESPNESLRAAYEERRTELKDALASELARNAPRR